MAARTLHPARRIMWRALQGAVPNKKGQQQESGNSAPKIRKDSRKLKSLKHKICLIVNMVQTSIEYERILQVPVTPLVTMMLNVYTALVLTPNISIGTVGLVLGELLLSPPTLWNSRSTVCVPNASIFHTQKTLTGFLSVHKQTSKRDLLSVQNYICKVHIPP
jgi:hypothetical protein